jgi:hypothetical protein
MVKKINKFLKDLSSWLFKWRMKMNVNKCSYILFGSAKFNRVDLALFLGNERIPYDPNPIFLGVTLDEQLSFAPHFEYLRTRALNRLNLLKIFSNKSWKLNNWTLNSLYRSLVGSIFDYSFFTLANVRESSLNRIQTVQNRAIRIMYKLPWDSSTSELFPLSGITSIYQRFMQLGCKYLVKALVYNPLIKTIFSEFLSSRSSINRSQSLVTPFCYFSKILSLSFALLTYFALFIIILCI